jgi:hypothetical protein
MHNRQLLGCYCPFVGLARDLSQLLLSYWPPCESHHLINSVQHVFACGLNTSLTVLSSYHTAPAVLRDRPSLASYRGGHGMIAEPGTRFSAVCTCARCLVAGPPSCMEQASGLESICGPLHLHSNGTQCPTPMLGGAVVHGWRWFV